VIAFNLVAVFSTRRTKSLAVVATKCKTGNIKQPVLTHSEPQIYHARPRLKYINIRIIIALGSRFCKQSTYVLRNFYLHRVETSPARFLCKALNVAAPVITPAPG
jgi:hypothetical protein